MRIIQVHTTSDIEAVRTLFREYERFLGVDLCFQGFEEELATLPGRYAPPQGRLLLAQVGEQAAGCVALRPLQEAGVCEMKRLFIRPAYRGQGLGLMLAQRIIHAAITVGYTVMRLDTLDTLERTMQIYETLGFQRCASYYANPLLGVMYWERALSKPAPALLAVSEQRRDRPDGVQR